LGLFQIALRWGKGSGRRAKWKLEQTQPHVCRFILS
jgi:hypothetical protein